MPQEKKNKNINLTDEMQSKQKVDAKGWIKTDEERDVLLFVKERFKAMNDKKKELGIYYKCDLYDRLYTPHRVLKVVDEEKEFERSHLTVDEEDGRKSNKSKPIAFEKVQTALAIIIKRNPQASLSPKNPKYKAFNELVKQAYEDNWDCNRLVIELRKFVFHLAKYGIAYARRYVKKKYKVIHTDDGKKRIVDFFDTIFETIHPKKVWLDENCDNPRNARDCFIIEDFTLQALKDLYPEEKYPNMKYVSKGAWLETAGKNKNNKEEDKSNKCQLAIYENEAKDIKLIIANGILISGVDGHLPAHQLSIIGDKWAEKDDSYDGIGVCQVLENYQPIIDDIANADIDLIRQMIRPDLYVGNGLNIEDEEDDNVDGQRVIKVDGDLGQMKWDRPPRDGQADTKAQQLSDEVSKAVGISDDLASQSEAKTLGQASFNRENSLRRLSLPLESIKYVIEDDARKALPLLKIVNSSPISTYEIEDEEELREAQEVLKQNPDDERFVLNKSGKIIRRKFKELELNIEYDKENETFNLSEDKKFWEMIPSTFDWEGKINIVPMSFLPKSASMEMQGAIQDMNLLLPIPSLDAMTGQPTLMGEDGQPYKINRLKLIKGYLKATNKDADEYIMPLTDKNVEGAIDNKPITNPKNLLGTAGEKAGTEQNV